MSGCKGGCKCKKENELIEKLKQNVSHLSCPDCGAEEEWSFHNKDSHTFQGYIAMLYHTCSLCGCKWRDVYKFLGKREVIKEGNL